MNSLWKSTEMRTFDVLRCAFTARTRVARALLFSVKRRPFYTKPVVPGVLHYDLEKCTRLSPLSTTFWSCAKAAKTPEVLIECFHKIRVPGNLLEVKWGGVCEESADFGSPDLKLYASEFYSVNEQRGRSFEEFCNVVLEKKGVSDDKSRLFFLSFLHNAFEEVHWRIQDAGSFANDRVKFLMDALILAPLMPTLTHINNSYQVCISTQMFMTQCLALQVGAVNVSNQRKNSKFFQGVTDTALWNEDCFTQLLIGEGIGEGSKENGLAHLVMAMLAQCAKSACTLQTIWGFTLSPNEYTIVKLEVIGKEVVVTQYPSCQHDLLFTNFIPLMGLSQRK
jgi:hypothetical protein